MCSREAAGLGERLGQRESLGQKLADLGEQRLLRRGVAVLGQQGGGLFKANSGAHHQAELVAEADSIHHL